MEQGLIAVGLGLAISIISYVYGFSNGLHIGKTKGISAGIKIGSISIFGILIKSKLIDIKIEDGYDTYVLRGNQNVSLTMPQLLDIVSEYQTIKPSENGNVNK